MVGGVESDHTRWAEVGEAVRARREDLGMSQVELAQAANVSETTVRVLETARRINYRRGNLRAIARALTWPDDAIDRLRAGRPPDEDLTGRDERTWEDRVAALEAEVARLREQLRARQPT
jgi:transcriptional regulator with XRE-family HTH domain